MKENWAIDNNQLPAWQIYFISLLIVANLDQLWSFFFANFCQFFIFFCGSSGFLANLCQFVFIIFGGSSRISANLCQSCTSFFLQFSLARHGKRVSFASSRWGNSQLKHRQIVSHVFAKLLQILKTALKIVKPRYFFAT